MLSLSSKNAPKGCHAFKSGDKIEFAFKNEFPCDKLWFYLGCDEKVLLEREMTCLLSADKTECVFELSTEEFCPSDGLFFCHFELEKDGNRFYTAFDEDEKAFLSEKFVNELQFLVYNEKYKSPLWLSGKTVYQIFPDRFARGGVSEKKIDAVYEEDWSATPEYPEKAGDAFPNNTHFGGTLWGVAEKIPYLKSLGVGCIYLNPIFDAYSNHKYDTRDFLSVDKTFGGDEALANLIEKAHENGISVILDGVFNHVGDDSVYFDKNKKYGGACADKNSKYFEWFSFESYPDVYESWWGISNLPKVRRVESYKKFICEEVIPKYMKMGVDGWRLDVADELESDFLDEITASVKKYKPDALMIGEVWEDASDKIAYSERKRYFRGSQLDGVTNYPLRNAMIDAFKYHDASVLVSTVRRLYSHYPPEKLAFLLNFLGSHDTERISTVFGGEPDLGLENPILAEKKMTSYERATAIEMLKNAYILLASLPGTPCIFYGDEYAMEGYHDPFNRRAFDWDKKEEKLFSAMSKINKLRAENDLFSSKTLECRLLDSGLAIFKRETERKELYILVNVTEKDIEYECGNAYDLIENKYLTKATLKPLTVRLLEKTK